MPKKNRKDYINLIAFFLKRMNKKRVKKAFEFTHNLWLEQIAEKEKKEPPDQCNSTFSRDSP